jgi:hypothetical protein
MDGIASAGNRSTDDLLRQAAADAGLEVKERLQGALGATFKDRSAELKEGTTNRAKQTCAIKAGLFGARVAASLTAPLLAKVEALADLATKAAPWVHVVAGPATIFGQWTLEYQLLAAGLVRPHAQADALRSTADNDAILVGLSHALDMPEAFKARMARMRAEVATHGGAAVAAQFAGKDRRMLPVLQQRADNGLVAARPWAERIAAAKTDSDRTAAMKALQQSAVGKVAGDDVAYSLGVAAALWAAGARGRLEVSPNDYEAIFNRAHARLDAARPPTRVQG